MVMDQLDFEKLYEKLEKIEERISHKIDVTVDAQAQKQRIICDNQCTVLKHIEEKINGNGKPGLLERMGVVEKSIKGYNYIIGIAMTAGVGFVAIDLIKKYLSSGVH